jgi:hypothetical protein
MKDELATHQIDVDKLSKEEYERLQREFKTKDE